MTNESAFQNRSPRLLLRALAVGIAVVTMMSQIGAATAADAVKLTIRGDQPGGARSVPFSTD